MRRGERPKMAIMAPPQHGKSWAATDFIAWVAGKNPNVKTIFASYSEALGERTNRDVQRIMRAPNYQLLFPNTRIGEQGWVCNTELIEFAGKRGSFRNTTVEGQINGFELHLGVIDDPVKGRAEVQYKTARDKTWNWFTDDLLSRMSKDSAILIMMTRWHVDDLLGRYLETEHNCRVLRFPAIAERDDPPFRTVGQALFPELKPLDFLEERRRQLTDAGWQSIYQQHPIVVGGGDVSDRQAQDIAVLGWQGHHAIGAVLGQGGDGRRGRAYRGCADASHEGWPLRHRAHGARAVGCAGARAADQGVVGTRRPDAGAVRDRRRARARIGRQGKRREHDQIVGGAARLCGAADRTEGGACGAVRGAGARGQRLASSGGVAS